MTHATTPSHHRLAIPASRFRGATQGLVVALLVGLVGSPVLGQIQFEDQGLQVGGETDRYLNQVLQVGRLPGSGPSAPPFAKDTDGDGLTDAVEEAGWQIVIDDSGYGPIALGSLLTIKTVTSNIYKRDTDGDGLDDKVEFLIGTDPRAADTDGDGLTDEREWNKWFSNPSTVDSDADSRGPDNDLTPDGFLFDGQELAPDTHITSPTLDDTDGDGRTDAEELYHPFYHPLIAELPQVEIVVSGDLDVHLDVEYAEDITGTTSYEATISENTGQSFGSNMSFSNASSSSYHKEVSKTKSFDVSLTKQFSFPKGGSFSAQVTGGLSKTTTEGNTWEIGREYVLGSDTESSQDSGKTYSSYVSESNSKTETAATGSVTLPIKLRNAGNFAVQVTDFGVALLRYEQPTDPSQPATFKAMGTIEPQTALPTLAPGEVSAILTLSSPAGSLNADVIKSYMAAPDSLVLQPANFNLVDQSGVDFDFITQNAFLQTAVIEIDDGAGNVDVHRIATNVQRNGGDYLGIRLGDALQDILGMTYGAQQVALDSELVTSVEGAPISLLTSLDGLQNAFIPQAGTWIVLLEGEALDAQVASKVALTGEQVEYVDFESLRVHPGDTVRIIYTKDEDFDGLWAREEQLHGTSDLTADSDNDLVIDGDEAGVGWSIADPQAPGGSRQVYSDPRVFDTDGDGLSDLIERAFLTDPRDPDTDKDGLDDSVDPYPTIPAGRLYVHSVGAAPSGVWDQRLDEALQDASTLNTNADPSDDIAEIWAATGTHWIFDEVSFPPGNVKVYGGFQVGDTKFGQRNPDPSTNGSQLSFSGDGSLIFDTSGVVLPSSWPTGTVDGFTLTELSSLTDVNGPVLEVLEGQVTLRNLNVVGIEPSQAFSSFPAVASRGASSLLVEDCTFTLCHHENVHGGAVHAGGGPAGSVFRNCQFLYNSAEFLGGAVDCGNYANPPFGDPDGAARPLFEDCLFLGNQTTSDCIGCSPSSWPYTGGGALALGIAGADIVNCDFVSNRSFTSSQDSSFAYGFRAMHGGAIFWDRTQTVGTPFEVGPLVVVNSRFFDNLAGHGSAIFANTGQFTSYGFGWLTATNCTFSGNTATFIDSGPGGQAPGGIINGADSPGGVAGDLVTAVLMKNCISYGNFSNGAVPADPAQSSFVEMIANIGLGLTSPSLVQYPNDITFNMFGGDPTSWGGPAQLFTNSFGDPKFENQAAGNLRPKSGSPAIDKGVAQIDVNPGKSGLQGLPPTDLDGNPRIVDGPDPAGTTGAVVDLGAYEIP